MAEEKTEPAKEATSRSSSAQNAIDDLYFNMAEGTLFRSPLVADTYKPPYNPDDIWQKRGDYSVYEDMGKDDQVGLCLNLKKDLVLGEGGHFTPEDDGQEEIVDELKTIFFEEYEGDFLGDIEEILTAYDFGFSITEKIFKQREAARLGLKRLSTRHPNSWRLYQDDTGKVTKYEQVTAQGMLDINPKSIIHYVNNKKFQNPYGESDLRRAYAAWFTKTQITRYMGIFLEKAASPIPVGRFDKNAPQTAVDKIFDILKKFQTKTAIVIPKEIEVEFLEAKNSGEAYIKAINLFNMFIGRALFIPDLLGFTGSETTGGSLALGKEQMNVFFLHIYRKRAAIENLINKELVRPIIQYNYGFVENYPKFRFKPLDEFKAVEMAKVWLEAVKGKTYKPNPEEINHFRKLVKFPEGEVEFDQPKPSPFDNPNGDPQDPSGAMDKEGMEEMPSEEGEKEDEKNGTNGRNAQDPKDKEDQKDEKSEEKKQFKKAYEPAPGDYSKKVDFKAIENKLNDYDKSVLNEAKPILKKMVTDLFDQIEKKKILSGQNAERIDSLSLKYKKELKQVLKSSFIQLFKDAQAQAQEELFKSEFRKPIASDKFLEVIENETFAFVGDYEYAILKRVRVELIAAIKDGKPLSTVLDVLDRDLGELSEVQLERFARTKHTEIMNNARVEYFESTGVVAAYQYSAILDDATSEICSGLHGKIFLAGSEPIPPMHFNCRSTLVPITKYEEFKPTESIRGQSPEDFIEENKGKGFSVK